MHLKYGQIAKKMTAEGLAPPKSATGSDVINFAFRVSMGSEFFKFVIICCWLTKAQNFLITKTNISITALSIECQTDCGNRTQAASLMIPDVHHYSRCPLCKNIGEIPPYQMYETLTSVFHIMKRSIKRARTGRHTMSRLTTHLKIFFYFTLLQN